MLVFQIKIYHVTTLLNDLPDVSKLPSNLLISSNHLIRQIAQRLLVSTLKVACHS